MAGRIQGEAVGSYGFDMIRNPPRLFTYQLFESFSVLIPPDDSAVGQNEAWKAVDSQFSSQGYILVNDLGFARGFGQGFLLVGIFEKGKGFFTNDRL